MSTPLFARIAVCVAFSFLAVDGYARESFEPAHTAIEQETHTGLESDSVSLPPPIDGVVLATGNKTQSEKDFASDGEMALYLTRTYIKQWSGRGIFGRNWLSNFDYSLAPQSINGQNLLWLQVPDGRRIKFIFNASQNRWNEDKPQPVAYIIRNADLSYTHFNEARGTERYNAGGYIIERRNEQGVVWAFQYSGKYLQSVTHSSGRNVQFTWTGNQVTQLVAPNGVIFTYTYTPNVFGTGLGRLASATRPGDPASTISYHYEDSRFPDALTGKTIDGKRYSWLTYDASGRVASTQRHGGAERHTFVYAIELVENVTPPPAPPPPGGYQDDIDQGWCEYRPGEGRICYHPPVLAPEPGAFGRGVFVQTSPVTKPRPTLFRVTVTNALGKQTIYRFDDAKLVSVESAASQYSAARYREISYDANGYPNLATDFKDAVTDYDYDAQGHLLKKVEAAGKPETRTTVFVWDLAKNRVLKETLVGNLERSFQYDAKGRVTAITDKNLNATNGVLNQTRTTSIAYTVGMNGLVSKIVSDGPLSGSADAVTQNFSALGDLTSASNSLGHTQSYSGHNGLGLPSRAIGANGAITDYTYDPLGRVRMVRQYPNGTAADTKYAYNGAGLVVAITAPDGHVQHSEYDPAHRPTMEFEQAASGYHTLTYEYNAMSLPTVIKTGTSQYRPDTRIAGVIDGVYQGGSGAYVSGWACSLYFDVSVRVHVYVGGPAGSGDGVANVDANRSSEPAVAQACQASGTAYRFSINIESLRAQHGGKKIYIHGISPVGRGNSLIARSGTFTVPPVTTPPPPPPPNPPQPPPNCGEAQCHEPIIFPDPGIGKAGGSGLLAQSTPIPYGTVDTIAYLDYDEEGRVRARRGNDGQNFRYTYDDNGNVETIKDSLNRITTMHYDALDRLVKSVDAKLKPTEFKYDAGDRVVWVKDPRGLITSYKYDGFGQLWSQASPDTGTTAFVYNTAGQRTSLTRNDGSSLGFTYDDPLGRLTMVSAPGLARDYYYDDCPESDYSKGRLCKIHMRDLNAVLSKSVFDYFKNGQLRARHDTGSGANDITRYVYDDMGRLTNLTYPSAVHSHGVVANYTYGHGKVTSLTATINGGTHNIATSIQHQPFGAVKSWTYGNGLVRNYNYDLDGRLTGISAAAGATVRQSLTYAWNANDLIEAVTNGVDAGQSHSYQYDELSRLTRETYPGNSTVIADEFDAVGNRTNRTRSDSGAVTSVIDYPIHAISNRMLSMSGSANRNFFYNPRGHLRASSGWLGNRDYVYDDFDRLKSTTVDGVTTSYLINALDQRVGKTGPLGAFRYVYAGQNTLLGEHTGASATGWKNYLYLHGRPVALVMPSGQLHYIHTDHLGRPESATRSDKLVVWKAANGSYSRTVTTDMIAGISLGFPGQIWDAETDTWYNGFRDYDPYTGRYIQSDPIGLRGGLNTYAYAGANPISYFDSLGLSKGGKRNLGVGGFTKRSNASDVEKALREAERNGQKEHAKNLRALLKVIKRGGTMSLLPLWITEEIMLDNCRSGDAAACGFYCAASPENCSETSEEYDDLVVYQGQNEEPDLYGEVGPIEDVTDEYPGDRGNQNRRGGGGGSIGGGGSTLIGTVTVGEPETADE